MATLETITKSMVIATKPIDNAAVFSNEEVQKSLFTSLLEFIHLRSLCFSLITFLGWLLVSLQIPFIANNAKVEISWVLMLYISLQAEPFRRMESIFVLNNARSNAISNHEKPPLPGIGGNRGEILEVKYC